VKCEEDFVFAFYNCPTDAYRNRELALTHLIPLRLLRGILPTPLLLRRFPRLRLLYDPFVDAVRRGDVKAFDAALTWAEMRLVDMGVFLIVERAREVCLSRLFWRTWVISNRPVHVPLIAFQLAMKVSGLMVSTEEVECLLANMIYKGYIRGYISHSNRLLVLSKVSPFPPLATRRDPAPA